MDKLKTCLMKKRGMFILSCFVVFSIVCIYPICFLSVYKLFFYSGTDYSIDRNLLDDLIIVLFAFPGSLPWCIHIKEYVGILLDIKMKKQITTKAKGRGRPELNFFDTHIPGSDNKDDIYFYWKAIDDSGKKYKFILFQEENNLKGKTVKHSYNVTYYKHSKIVTNIERCQGKK